MTATPHIPILRFGRPYESLDQTDVLDARGSAESPRALARVSQANAGLIRRDLARQAEAAAALRALSTEALLAICARAAELFMSAELPLGQSADAVAVAQGADGKGAAGAKQSPEDYVAALSVTSGLPHALVRRNMAKIHHVLANMETILRGLTRGLELALLDSGFGRQDGVAVSFYPTADALGVVLPSNSPGVNSIWLPAFALKTPVVLKPGREEPWTPWRLIQALIAGGAPPEAFAFYPTDHEGAQAILKGCGRALLFGDEATTAPYAGNPAVQLHGPGRSKVLISESEIERWPELIDLLAASVADNGGRSCINASTIVVPAHGDEIAEALAWRLARIEPRASEDPEAALAAFANPRMAEAIDGAIEQGLAVPGAREVSAAQRGGPRLARHEGGTFLRPTVVRCQSFAHPLANREFLFPFVSVVEAPQDTMLEQIGPSLVVTAVVGAGARDRELVARLLASPLIERLNLGEIPTSHVEWDQPHEGNLFEFLYRRRAIQVTEALEREACGNSDEARTSEAQAGSAPAPTERIARRGCCPEPRPGGAI